MDKYCLLHVAEFVCLYNYFLLHFIFLAHKFNGFDMNATKLGQFWLPLFFVVINGSKQIVSLIF